MNHEGAAAYRRQLGHEVVIAEALPDGLLHAADDAERGQVACGLGVGEVTRDAELEGTVSVRLRVALPETRCRELLAESAHLRRALPPRELGLELLPVSSRDRRRVDQE